MHTIENKMTDKLPLFMVQGAALFVQNVTGVTKTSQLSYDFIMIASFTLSSRTGSPESFGRILSLNDYENV